MAASGSATMEPAKPPPVKRDWYQTESDVFVNVLAKNLKKEDVSVDFSTDTVTTKLLAWIYL